MAQPTIYERETAFEDFQSTHPSTPLPGNLVDQEFDAITASLEEFGANLALIQRDDGEVANQTIGYDQLKSEVVIGFNEPTPWATATSYAASDAVFVGASIYRAVSAHTSGAVFNTDLAAGKWEELFDFSVFVSNTAGVNWIDDGWALGVQHAVNDGLGHNGASYRCTVAHMSTSDTEPGVGADWEDYWVVIAAKGDVGDQGAAATVTIGNVNTGAAGSEATVVNSGTENAAVLDITIPRGFDGVDGVDGAAATIAVGTVATGAPGTDVIVTNVGTANAAIFDITIPRGDTGESGSGSGDMLAATYDPTNIAASAFARANHTGTQAASTISDFNTAADARVSAAIGATVQAYSANLDEYAAVNPTAAGLALLDDADAAAQRTTLGLGTSAVKNTGTSGNTVPLLDGANIWSGAQTITTTAAASTILKLESTDASASGGPQFDIDRNSASPAANDIAGIIRFLGRDSGGNTTTYGNINATVLDPTDGSEDGRLILQVPVAGAQTSAVSIANGMIVGAPTGSYQGTGTINATGYYLNGTALSSTLFGVAVGTASGNLKVLNADGGFTFATTATSVNIAGNFGGTWVVGHRKYSSDTATFAGSRATEAIMREVTGSGTNGPDRADYGLHVEAWKTSYLTSAVQGEIDGMNIVVRQGELGDTSALLFNTAKVESATYGQTGLEGLMRWVQATTGTVLRDFKVTMGANIPGTDLRSGGSGFTMRSTTGDTGGAFNALSDAGTTIARVLTASSSLLAANTYYEITGNGHADGGGLTRASAAAATKPAYSFVGDDDTGLYSASANVLGIATGGTVRMLVGPGVRIGSGLTDPGAGALIATASLHAYAATAIPANGTTGSGIKLSSTSNFGIFFGSGAPTLSAAQGSIYLRSDGSTTSNRIYVNTNGSTAWTAITTAA